VSAINDCATCADRLVNGRADRDPMHCRECHAEWTGLEAQHCLGCHHTFVGIGAADSHHRRPLLGYERSRHDAAYCLDPTVTPGWREKHPGVWTDAEPWDGLT
jgi:hypothetical protein